MKEKITLGAGCFWCVEAVFDQIKGVESILPAYAGGKVSNPTYKEVCSGLTGHAEVVQLEYDSKVVGLEEILSVFFQSHDPTTLNRQGGDVGTQYRSAIFYHNDRQKEIAEKVKATLEDSAIFDKPIVTEITAINNFYPAEKEHLEYYKNNPEAAYCQMVIRPKVERVKKLFATQLNEG